ncbi:helix-turn-helix domain-containing protein [Streptomyces longisporus]|uniref:HTH cro/C1-type domain-containing protein n=1 Tax=Streptomyces longisporus TaxID=1948 RepID=A0ABN3N612_STRLO
MSELIMGNERGGPQQAGVGALKPLAPDLPPAKRELAKALRALYRSTGLTVRQCARQCHLDASVVSRYLSGARIPPWEFVTALASGAPLNTHDLGLLLEQALQEDGGDAARIAMLHLQLAKKGREALAAQRRAKDLEEQVTQTQKELSTLQKKMKTEIEKLEKKILRARQELKHHEEDAQPTAALEAKLQVLEKEKAKKKGDLAFSRKTTITSWDGAYVGPDAFDCGY